MRRILIRPTLPLLLLLAFVGTRADAGSWAQGKGHFYAKLGTSYLAADELATPSGEVVPIPDYERREANLYLEYGLSDRWTLIADAPFYRYAEIDGFGDASGVGDLRLGLQLQLAQSGPWVFAGRAVVQAPTGDETKGEGILPTGTGVWEGEAWLSLGRTFAGGRSYGFVEAGHQERGAGLTDGFVYRTQVGVHATERLLLAFNVWGVEPYEERGSAGLGSVSGLGDGVQYLAYGPTLILGLGDGWAVQLDVDGAERIRNFASGVTYRLGISLER